MVADVSSANTTPNSKVLSRSPAPSKPNRAPLLPSETDNNAPNLPRRPKPKDIINTDTSSCSSSSTTTTSPVCTPKRRFPDPVNNRRHFGNLRTCARSLSVSFQGESFALPVSKVEKPANNGLRNSSLERKKVPARSRQGNLMTMSVDFTNEKMKLSGSRVLRKSMTAETKLETVSDDSDDVRGGGGGPPLPRAIVVPARFWEETIYLVRRVPPDSVSPPLLKNKKVIRGCKVLDDGLNASSRGSPFIPVKRVVRPAASSNSNSNSNNLRKTNANAPSALCLSGDVRRGKVGEKKIVDAHMLRLLHNKYLQWRFANAKVNAAMLLQRATALKSLYNAWVTISKLWRSVISKRVQIQQLKQTLKLLSILKKQMSYLNNWDLTDKAHSVSLAGAINALETSSLCLPVLCGAKADVQNLKDAICSAVDVMEAMAVSTCSLVTKVEHVNLLACELATAMKTECSLLDQCKDLFGNLTILEMQECSLRIEHTHYNSYLRAQRHNCQR